MLTKPYGTKLGLSVAFAGVRQEASFYTSLQPLTPAAQHSVQLKQGQSLVSSCVTASSKGALRDAPLEHQPDTTKTGNPPAWQAGCPWVGSNELRLGSCTKDTLM
jgi:hypothetical protein